MCLFESVLDILQHKTCWNAQEITRGKRRTTFFEMPLDIHDDRIRTIETDWFLFVCHSNLQKERSCQSLSRNCFWDIFQLSVTRKKPKSETKQSLIRQLQEHNGVLCERHCESKSRTDATKPKFNDFDSLGEVADKKVRATKMRFHASWRRQRRLVSISEHVHIATKKAIFFKTSFVHFKKLEMRWASQRDTLILF